MGAIGNSVLSIALERWLPKMMNFSGTNGCVTRNSLEWSCFSGILKALQQHSCHLEL